MVAVIDVTGQRFGRLVVAARAASDKDGRAMWLCNCDCGRTSAARGKDLRSGNTMSCGCYEREVRDAMALVANLRHGHSGGRDVAPSPTYQSWRAMKKRCLNLNHTSWPDYGGRGITICDRWLDFEGFLADMGERPAGTSIDRIDNDGNYEPSNCRWATGSEQRLNQRRRDRAY